MDITDRYSGSMNRKLFRSVFLSYLLILLVSIGFLITGYFFSIRQAKNSIEEIETTLLEQIRSEVDLRFSTVAKVSNLLATNDLTQSVSEQTEEKLEYQLVYQKMMQFISVENELLDNAGEVSVYFMASDSVMATPSRYRSVNLDAYTYRLGMTVDEFHALVIPEKKVGAFYVLHPNTDHAELLYILPVIGSNLKQVGTVITRISMNYLEESIQQNRWMDGSIFHIQYADALLRVEGNGKWGSLSKSDVSLEIADTRDSGPVETVIDGEKYMTMGLRSNVSDWKYFFSVPNSTFHHTTMIYVLLFSAFLGVALVFGTVMAFIFSHRLSKPLQKILDSLKLNNEMAYPEAFASLNKALESYQSELSSAKSLQHYSGRREISDLLYAICRGSLPMDKVLNGLKRYAVPLENRQMMLIQFQHSGAEASIFYQDGFLDRNLMYYASRNVIRELLCPKGGEVFTIGDKTYCIYQPEGMLDKAVLKVLLDQLLHFHQEVLHVGLSVIATGPCENLSTLPELMAEVEEADQYRSFWDGDTQGVLFYDEAIGYDTEDRTNDAIHSERRFVNLLSIRDYKGAYEVLLEQLNSGLSKNLRNFQRERYRIYGFISNLLEAIVPEGECKDDMDALNEAMNRLLAARNLTEVKERVDCIFQQMINRNESGKLSGYPYWIQEMRNYIEEHYDDPQLDVSYLAEKYHVNLSYLSRTYKEAYSIGVLDNIHMVRIAHAKELLAKGVTVQETSYRVGYQESRSLIRAFKRYENITPGQYQASTEKR